MLRRLAQLVGVAGTPKPRAHPPRRLVAKFDAAQTTPENRRHWANADGLAADAACSPEVRRVLRDRARYEAFNNPFTDGQVQTLASDIVGRGPRLQLLTADADANEFVEAEFAAWASAVHLAEKLRLFVTTRVVAGECFGLRVVNPRLPTPVKLDLKVIEPDQVASPTGAALDPSDIDGVHVDANGEPVAYDILLRHPGDNISPVPGRVQAQRIDAADVLHLFRPMRPGQHRGVPQIASALPLYAQRRRFRMAVVKAAEVAAQLGAILLETDLPPDSDSLPEGEPFESLDLEFGMMTTLPTGYKGRQMEPAQPGTTYREFDDKLINEAARPLSMPFNIAACDSSKYNYASGRLDHQTYDRMIEVDHLDLELKVLDRVLAWWLEEAAAVTGYLPAPLRGSRTPHKWLWRGRPHVDPTKEAEAQRVRLASRTATLTDELARDGIDLEAHLDTLAREAEAASRAGLGYQTPLPAGSMTAVLEVLARLRRGQLTAFAGVECLIALGIPRARAVTMASREASEAEPAAPPAPEAVEAFARLNQNGVLHHA